MSSNPYYYDVAETMDIGTTPHDTYTEYSDRIRDSTNFEEAIAIFGEYAQEHYSITVTQLTEEMERNGSLYSPPSQDASPAVAHKLLEALSDIPPSLVEDIDYKLEIQIVGEIVSFDDDGSQSKNGTFFSNQLTRKGTITLSASNHYVYKTFHHELQHAIDTQLGCLDDDPQFDEQNPAWLTEELRREIYESDDHLSDDTIHGGNYSLKSTGEEKANMASQLFSGEDIPERHISPVIRAKTALLMNQLYELDPDAALWFWWRITDPEGERAGEAYVNTLEGLE